MSTRVDAQRGAPIASRNELVHHLEQGCKPPADWRIGTEHEKFPFHLNDLTPLAYEGNGGIRALLDGMASRFGWTPVMEGGNVIALKREPGQPGGGISLEPGGQFELSGAPLANIHETAAEMAEHIRQVKAVGADLGIGFLGMGFSPKWSRAETPKMPKGRYAIMTAYMPKVGKLGLDMMYRSCTVQTNLDFGSEADMVKKLRVSLALQPVVTAIFANSPLTEGRPNGYLDFRSAVWLDTDNQRAGMLPFAFEPGMGFERYVDYALDVPMYFVYRGGRYIDASGKSFRAFLDGKLDVVPGERPDMDDWADHLSTLFPEVRLKQFLEMRGADAGMASRVSELPALWVGLLYDSVALDAAWDLVKDWTAAERLSLRNEMPTTALATPFRRTSVGAIAKQVVTIAEAGLQRRAVANAAGDDERVYLDGLRRIVDSGRTSANEILDRFNGSWRGDVAHAFTDYRF